MRLPSSSWDISWWSSQLTPFKRLWLTLGFFILIFFAGTFGYVLIEGWPLADSFYMTIITISTVGFQEVKTLSENGRIFTACLIVIGIGTFGYGFANISTFFIEGEFKELIRTRKMEKIIENIASHIIICGYGDEGRHAGEELSRSKVPFIIIEKKLELTEKLREDGLLVIHGDATQDDVLLKAGVAVAKGLIAAVPEDSVNVFVALTARGFNPDLKIGARAADESSIAKLFRAGANKVVSSAEIGGRRMASMLLRPKVVNFLDVIMSDQELALRLEEININKKSPFVGKSIRGLDIRGRTGTLVIAYQGEGQSININPSADTTCQAGDVLIVLGNEKQVADLQHLARSE